MPSSQRVTGHPELRMQVGRLILAGILFLAGSARSTIADGLMITLDGEPIERSSLDLHGSRLVVPIGKSPEMNETRATKV